MLDGDTHERTPLQNELSLVIDALPGLVWTAFPDGRADFLNQRWCEYTGVRLTERWAGVADGHPPRRSAGSCSTRSMPHFE
jgi:PAS domain-containing protein